MSRFLHCLPRQARVLQSPAQGSHIGRDALLHHRHEQVQARMGQLLRKQGFLICLARYDWGRMSLDLCPECGAASETIIDENGNPGWRCPACGFRVLEGSDAEWKNREYQATNVRLFRDGNQFCAMVGI